jgi:hypothetical protein
MTDFLDPRSEIKSHGRLLPHWQQGEVMQFITFRLKDDMPREKLLEWEQDLILWKRHHPLPWSDEVWRQYHHRFTWRLEEWLDAGSGSCLLADTTRRDILAETIMHDHGNRANHHAWVIMPNHAHLLLTPLYPIDGLLKNWKGISARRMGNGSIWQKGYRDTMIRDEKHFANVVRYIRRNPVGLPRGSFTLWQGERALEVE